MTSIFISYRREDSADITGRINDRLVAHFGRDAIFTDVDRIPFGVDFRQHINAAVSQCDFLLAVIGKDWLTERLNHEADFVRIEIESALRRDIPVIPLLVRGASMPSVSELPESLHDLAFRNGPDIRPDPDFNNDLNRLITNIATRRDGTVVGQPETVDTEVVNDDPKVDASEKVTQAFTEYAVETGKQATPDRQSGEDAFNNDVEHTSSLKRAKGQTKRSTSYPPFLFVLGGLVAFSLMLIAISKYQGSEPQTGQALPATDPISPDLDLVAPDMVTVPAGTFLMGSNKTSDEQPMHQVTVPAFEIARNELTWAEWQLCEDDNGCKEIDWPDFFDQIDASERSRHPVVNVSIDEVNEYLGWINRRTGLTYRLPSEAEWEYAARAGSTTAYSWGDAIGENRANCWDCGSEWDRKSTAPVGSFDANPFGLHDMHGNVWEWVADCWHENYKGAPDDGSAWANDCTAANVRLVRGGSWYFILGYLRGASRNGYDSDGASADVGFRLARTLP